MGNGEYLGPFPLSLSDPNAYIWSAHLHKRNEFSCKKISIFRSYFMMIGVCILHCAIKINEWLNKMEKKDASQNSRSYNFSGFAFNLNMLLIRRHCAIVVVCCANEFKSILHRKLGKLYSGIFYSQFYYMQHTVELKSWIKSRMLAARMPHK